MKNLARLLMERCGVELTLGTVDRQRSLAVVVDEARQLATGLLADGLRPGQRAALIGTSSLDYLRAWMALQLCGIEAALLNPDYPRALLGKLVADLQPMAVLWCGRPPDPQVGPEVRHIDMSTRWEHPPQPWEALAGLSRQPDDVAGYMHTSGTSGTPKLCAQTHRYFLSLARVVADGMSLSPADRVYVPLPLYHVNPLGYGVLGGLMGCADIVLGGCFSASRFWPDVIGCAATVLMLHSPPVEILKRSTSQADAAGHVVRSAFLADRSFQQKFGIPLVWSAYGSTEGGGLSHLWGWRLGEPAGDVLEASRVGGRCRDDIRWSLSSEGEILLRGEQPGLLVRGYRKKGDVPLPVDAEGWFHTGDLGRIDDEGRLVFVERLAESIRVKGEYVPIGYVEDRLAAVAGISDLAVWRRDSELVDHELVLYIVADTIPVQGVTAASQSLPPFMRPSVIRRVPRVPRDEGVGKVRRRELDSVPVLEEARIR